jgi:hypothetical protein
MQKSHATKRVMKPGFKLLIKFSSLCNNFETPHAPIILAKHTQDPLFTSFTRGVSKSFTHFVNLFLSHDSRKLPGVNTPKQHVVVVCTEPAKSHH